MWGFSAGLAVVLQGCRSVALRLTLWGACTGRVGVRCEGTCQNAGTNAGMVCGERSNSVAGGETQEQGKCCMFLRLHAHKTQ